MSLKGFGKAVVRAPQSFRQKFNMGEQSSDPVYEDAERRFKELEQETKKLSDESKRYHTAVDGMLSHQIGFSKAMAEIFRPISGKMSDPNAAVPEDNPQGIEATEQYSAVVAELQNTLKPDLALIAEKVVGPCQELLKIIAYIRKMSTKRQHKKLDYDRKLNTYSKYENKKEPTPKDEERMIKAQVEMETAQQEYDYYNELLKTQLPILFGLEAQFVQPLFVSFYYMQLNIFYTLYSRFQEMKIPYFNLDSDIVEAFMAKRGNVEELTDALTITHFKIGYSKAKLEMTRRRFGADGSPGASTTPTSPGYPGTPGYSAGTPGYGAATPGYATSTPGFNTTSPGVNVNSPGYPASAGYSAGSPGFTSPSQGYGAQPGQDYKASYQPAAAAAPTPGTPAPPYYNPATETVTALYDYQAQAAGDLSFPAGAVIEVVQRTQDTNEWWTGRYNGQQGVFPGNYVRLN